MLEDASARETIFALSSAHGRAGVAIIRVSGPQTRAICVTLCGSLPAPREARLSTFRDLTSGEIVDRGIVLFFAGPASFTGEDVAEFHCHGSIAVIRRLLCLLRAFPGCRDAAAGEFMRRAHENGKIDALDIESLGDILEAETEFQRRLAIDGSIRLRNISSGWRKSLIDSLTLVEAHIDFSDEGDVTEFFADHLSGSLLLLETQMRDICASKAFAERIRDGFRVAVLGPVNAGKSSLVNALADREFAIVSPQPGTTRDVLEAHLDLDGVPIVISDTAGFRNSIDLIEIEGIRRAEAAALKADLVLWVTAVDSPVECPCDQYMIVHSKADICDAGFSPPVGSLLISARSGTGISELAALIRQRALTGDLGVAAIAIVAHERQAVLLLEAAEALNRAVRLGPEHLDLIAEEIRSACRALDRLIGKIGTEDILDALFARFCIGK